MSRILTNSKQRTIGVILQYSQMILSILISLVYTPVMLNILGQNEYGIYNIASSAIAYLSMLSLGFGSSYLKFYSGYKGKEDNEGIKKLNGLYLIVFSIIGLISLVAGLFLSSHVGWFYNDSYTAEEMHIANVLMLLLTFNLAFSFPASVFGSYITSQQKFIFQKIIGLGKTVFSPAVVIIFLYLGYGSIGMVLTSTLISLIVDTINVYYCLGKLKMKLTFKEPNWHLLKDIFAFSVFIAINQVIDQINWSTDKIILGKLATGSAVAIYSVGASLNSMFLSLSTTIASVFSPKINMLVAKQEDNMDDELTKLMIRVGRIQWFILSLALSGFILFGKYFIEFWTGQGYSNSYYVALLLMAPAIVPLIQNVGIEIQRAKNKHQFRSIIYGAMAVLNIIISIILAKKWAEIGVAVGTTISIFVCNGVVMNIFYHKALNIDMIKFWKSIIKTAPSFIPALIVGVLILNTFEISSILELFIAAIVYTSVYLIGVFFLGLNSEEKSAVNGVIKKVLKR